jgi:ligand-binding sensor domain-containing protein
LAIDSNHLLWVGCEKGLYRFDTEKEQLVPFIDSLKNVQDVFVDKKGQLWFSSNVTLCRYNFQKKKLTVFRPSQYFQATSICQTADGYMWFSTANGYLQRYDEVSNSFRSYPVFDPSVSVSTRGIEKIITGDHSLLFIGTSSHGIKEFNCSTGIYSDLLQYNSDKTTIFVRDILKVRDNEYWFATESGIFILNPQTDNITNLKKKIS